MNISFLLGKTISDIQMDRQHIIFTLDDGTRYVMYHRQDCCERVIIEDIDGDLQDLVGSPLLQAEESSNRDFRPYTEYDDSVTWTFYKLATINGYVTIRWCGSSNGYYSESVSFDLADDAGY